MERSFDVVAIAGASGLVGSALLPLLCARFRAVHVLTRRPLLLGQSGVQEHVVSFTDTAALQEALQGCTHVFCTVGTTRKKVQGNKAAFRQVDVEIPLQMAQAALVVGVHGFWMVSSVGAHARSTYFYLRIKGEAEAAVCAVGLHAVGIFRPSMLLGDRNESRPLERMGQWLMQGLKPLIPSAYKPIHATQVARAMVGAAQASTAGNRIWHYNDMMQY